MFENKLKKLDRCKYSGTLYLIDRKPLAKLSANPPRTRSVTGYFDIFPKENIAFIIYSEPLDDLNADVRIFTTSVIHKIGILGNDYHFETINSFYTLTSVLKNKLKK